MTIGREHVRAALEDLIAQLRADLAEEFQGIGYATEDLDVEVMTDVVLVPADLSGEGVQVSLTLSCLPVRIAAAEEGTS